MTDPNPDWLADAPALLTIDEVAEYLRQPRRTVARWAAEGLLPTVKLPNRRMVSKTDLVGWLKARHSSAVEDDSPPPQ